MDKCRICLCNRKTLISVFENYGHTTFAYMMNSIASVTIVENDEIMDKICRSCRRSLQEAFELKLLIERSDAVLHNCKKIKFNNINDIQLHIDIDCKKSIKKCKEENKYNDNQKDKFLIGDTVIKKVINSLDDVCNKSVPILEFLRTCNSDINDTIDDTTSDVDMHCYGLDSGDDEYVPHQLLDTNSKKKTKPNIKKKITKPESKISIKPVYLSDFKLIHTKGSRTKKKNTIKNKSEQQCPYCGILMPKRTLEIHLLRHTGEQNYKCDECGKKFFTQSGLIGHKKTIHTSVKDFKCDICTASFAFKCALRSHMVLHYPERNYVCDICNKTFKRKPTLKRHKMMHNASNKTIQCERCSMSFFSNPALNHHMRIHTGERPYNCQICSQPYSYKRDFNRHCLKKHGVFLSRRPVYVMNEEVLKHERALMKDLVLRVNGILKDDKPLNPFEGPQAAIAFEQALKALENRQISIDF